MFLHSSITVFRQDKNHIYIVNLSVKLLQADVIASKIKNKESEVSVVQSVLPKIITNSFSRAISWGGTQKTKIAFNQSKTYESIQGEKLLIHI